MKDIVDALNAAEAAAARAKEHAWSEMADRLIRILEDTK